MFPWTKRDAAAPLPPAAIPRDGGIPWQGAGLTATEVDLPRGRKGAKLMHCVQLTTSDLTVTMLHAEILELLDGRISMVDPMGASPDVFLCNAVGVDAAATAGRASEAGKWMAVFPADALALMVVPVSEPPAAVMSGSDVASFSAWARKLAK
ncbi:hypothetical protein [Arthrobacter glacialis]|uniref:hypothetical protein n=1 Tax=Arthrobacter glacialis TaxID=1664 RepID=UPI000CD3C428|nr:hypothetical protein [Arthrobacter glacialis]POH60999.1 hypothetical protein CVS28_00355 [Arthrobacter glacialis]